MAFALRRRQSREAARSKNGEKGDEQVYRGRRLIATQWQPVHAQAILGSIPEEFRGDWYWQENTNGPEIYRSGACKFKAGFLNIDRMTLDTGRLSCVFDGGTAGDGTLNMRLHCSDPTEKQPSMYGASSYGLTRRSNSLSSRLINSAGQIESGQSIN